MAASGDDGARAPDAGRTRPDRRAEALRANLKRRKAQARARDEARPADAPPAPAPATDDPAG